MFTVKYIRIQNSQVVYKHLKYILTINLLTMQEPSSYLSEFQILYSSPTQCVLFFKDNLYRVNLFFKFYWLKSVLKIGNNNIMR
jgi:hypothetical protein